MSLAGRIATFSSLVRFSHTIFALPFGLMGAILAAGGMPPLGDVALIVLAMVGARSASMSMNRLADHRIDAENPRTLNRELPRGALSRTEVWVFLIVSVGIFLLAAALLNEMTLVLSPVALAVLLSYPFAKRFTSFCHLWLGAALGLGPVGAWVAVRGDFGPGFAAVAALGGAVVLWTAGFDIIYALLDVEFDRARRFFSVPARLGVVGGLVLSAVFHAGAVAGLVAAGVLAELGPWWFAGVGGAAALLLLEHAIVRPSDLSRVNTAFFTLNGLVSVLLLLMLVADVMAR